MITGAPIATYPSLGPWYCADSEKWFSVVRVGNQVILEGDGETFWLNPETGLMEDISRGDYEDQLRNLAAGDFETATDYDECGNRIWTYLTETGEEEQDEAAKGNRAQIASWLTDPIYDGLAAIYDRGA